MDVSLFHLRYNNRMGTQAMYDENDVFYLYRTNIGNSVTDGAELFAEYGIRTTKEISLSLFTSTAFFFGVFMRRPRSDRVIQILRFLGIA